MDEKWADDLVVSINDRKSVDTSQVLYLPPITGEVAKLSSPYRPKVPLKGKMHVSLVKREDSDGLLEQEDADSETNFNLEVRAIIQQSSH